MNILMIGELYSYGGASEIMEVIAKNLRNKGHKIILVYGYNYKKYKVEPNNYVLFENNYVRAINNNALYFLEKFDLPNLYVQNRIKNIIKKENIDLIHFHTMQGGYISLKDIEYLSNQYNVIWTVHDTWPFTGGCIYYSDCDKWLDRKCSECVEDEIFLRYKNTYKHYLRKKKMILHKNILYVAPSQWMFNNIKKSFLNEETSVCIENGINIDVFIPLKNKIDLKNKYGINQSKNILMFIAGNINNKYKGWKYLIEALKMIKNHEKYELLIVGELNDNLKMLPIETKIVGFVKEKSILNELYNIADVFIIPSIQDNFPTVTIEAQAAGTPVIAFPVGGIKEQVTDETGWILSKVSSKELAETIDNIFLSDNFKDVLERKGDNARWRCEKLFNEKIMCEKYEKIYLGKIKYEKN